MPHTYFSLKIDFSFIGMHEPWGSSSSHSVYMYMFSVHMFLAFEIFNERNVEELAVRCQYRFNIFNIGQNAVFHITWNGFVFTFSKYTLFHSMFMFFCACHLSILLIIIISLSSVSTFNQSWPLYSTFADFANFLYYIRQFSQISLLHLPVQWRWFYTHIEISYT